MQGATILPDELAQAAAALEKRLEILDVPARNVALEEWETLPDDIRPLIPRWVPVLISNYKIVGATLEFQHHNRDSTWQLVFGFHDPRSFAFILEKGGLYRPLIDFGFFPFASESDGSMWLATTADGPSGKVYLLELSGWAGDEPTEENGLIYAHKSLAHLISAMAIGNESFEEPDDCVWGKIA